MRAFGVVLVGALAASNLAAQSAEVRSGIAIGSHSETLAGLEIEPHVSVDLVASYPLIEGVQAFVAGSYNNFGCRDEFCAGGRTVTAIHGIVGGEYRWRFLWGRAGGMYGTVGVEGSGEMGPGLYVAAGGGVRVLGVEVLPGFSHRWMMSGDERAFSITGDVGVKVPFL